MSAPLWLLAAPLALAVLAALATQVIAWVVEARHPPAGRFVPVTGGRLHVLERGSPESRSAVVLLHGASGSAMDPMMAFGERLPEDMRVLAVDRPGHGWSDRIGGAAAAAPARQAAIIREGLRGLGVERAVLVGHSWSGALALRFALDHPDLVAGLVLLAPVSHPWPGGISWYYGPATAAVVGTLFTRTVTAPIGALMLEAATQGVFAPQVPPPDYIERAGVPLVLRPRTFQANAEDVAGLHAAVSLQSPRYPEIQVPVTIISGALDRVVWTSHHSRSLEREIPGARLLVLPGIGHMPHHAAPDLVVEEIGRLASALQPAPRAGGPTLPAR